MRSIWQGRKQWLQELAHEKQMLPALQHSSNARLQTIFKTHLLRIAAILTQKILKTRVAHTRY
jgi:hypothetical protein